MPESDFEQNLYQLRRDKLKQIEALGQQAYPNSYAFTHTVPELRAFDTPENTVEELAAKHIEASIAGRIMAIRVQGKAGFAQLQQGGERLQVYVRKDDVGEQAFALYKLLDLGDHVGVCGYLMRTRTGELTLHAKEVGGQPAFTFLAKAMLALPDKYHGLEDTELRYRQRYVDLFMNTGHGAKSGLVAAPPTLANDETVGEDGAPGSFALAEEGPLNVRETFVKRAAILRAIRRFFDERGFLEVETPMLHTVAGGAAARPFKTHHNALDIPLSLRIAPELFLKRLVVGGLDRVYEINRNFRNEGVSTRHNPEFTMLEFYQAYANYHDLMELTQELIAFVALEVNGTTICSFNGNEIDLSEWSKMSMRQAIEKWWDEGAGPLPSDEAYVSATRFGFALDDAEEHLARINLNSLQKEALDRHFRMRAAIHAARQEINDEPSYGPTDKMPNSVVKRPSDLIILKRPSIEDDKSLHGTHGSFDDSKGLSIAASADESVQEVVDLNGVIQEADNSAGRAIAAFFEVIAELHLIQPTIIYDFPLAVSPLSKQKPDDPDWVERFEFYIGGFEVGNAFSELNDPDEQRKRFEAQLAERDRGDDEAHQMDEDYVRALGYGLPPTAGEGIGIDRLTMILTGAKSIRDVILFPLMRPHANP